MSKDTNSRIESSQDELCFGMTSDDVTKELKCTAPAQTFKKSDRGTETCS